MTAAPATIHVGMSDGVAGKEAGSRGSDDVVRGKEVIFATTLDEA